MSIRKYRKQIIIMLAAAFLSVGIIRWNYVSNVPPCISSPGCNSSEIGKLTFRRQGYPLIYREVVTFEPNSDSPIKYAISTAEPEGFSTVHIIINIIFWYAVLDLVIRLYKGRKPLKKQF